MIEQLQIFPSGFFGGRERGVRGVGGVVAVVVVAAVAATAVVVFFVVLLLLLSLERDGFRLILIFAVVFS